VLSGHLEGEVRAPKQRKAVYDEIRRLSYWSGTCLSDSDGSAGNETAPELDIGSPALEGAGVVAAQKGDLGREGLGSLQHQGRATAVSRKRVQVEPRGGEV
jgi:hypothetical protein